MAPTTSFYLVSRLFPSHRKRSLSKSFLLLKKWVHPRKKIMMMKLKKARTKKWRTPSPRLIKSKKSQMKPPSRSKMPKNPLKSMKIHRWWNEWNRSVAMWEKLTKLQPWHQMWCKAGEMEPGKVKVCSENEEGRPKLSRIPHHKTTLINIWMPCKTPTSSNSSMISSPTNTDSPKHVKRSTSPQIPCFRRKMGLKLLRKRN